MCSEAPSAALGVSLWAICHRCYRSHFTSRSGAGLGGSPKRVRATVCFRAWPLTPLLSTERLRYLVASRPYFFKIETSTHRLGVEVVRWRVRFNHWRSFGGDPP